jgi:hypothetical protein
MNSSASPFRVRAALVAIAVSLPGLAFLHGQEKPPPGEPQGLAQADKKSPQAWTLDEAMEQLRLFPNDAYLQYVALQLARREKQIDPVAAEVARLIGGANGFGRVNERVNDIDLFSLFTGALAVQESLQLDAMRGGRRPVNALAVRPGGNPVDPAQRRRQTVAVTDIAGPTIKSHPWDSLLNGATVDGGPLSRAVPEDVFFIEFRSLTKMLDAMELSDLWGTHLFNQATRDARTQQVGERMKTQLALETNPLLRPAYDLVVDGVAVTGSDLFLREGSDVTLLFRAKVPEALKARMDGFLDRAAKAHPRAKRTAGKYGEVEYVHLETPDRSLCVYSAYPAPGLHVRSNSKVALERVLAAVAGKDSEGKVVRRLGETPEFQYIRTLMPRGAREEDGFVYLSDAFIRRLMGPAVKLTERRRVLCYNHLRMIGHAALLYRTEHGRAPASLEELVKAECLPAKFNQGDFTCPDGGEYTLSADSRSGTCSHHGHAGCMTPCCEIPVTKVNGEEADEYKGFLDEYNRYWRMYFDPIALRLQITPQRYRIETIILPLIDNSIYTALSQSLGGAPEALDALPVPKRNIFSVAVKLNKLELLKEIGLAEEKPGSEEKSTANKNERPNASNLQQLILAIINHADTSGGKMIGPAAIRDKDGKPLLSWRVAILPFIEQVNLYQQFKLDEPWDSDHNKKLIAKMPAVFRTPGSKAGEGKTTYLLPVGKGAMFADAKADVRYPASITDGTSNTILIVDAADDQAVEWTKPDDLKYDAKDPLKGLAVRNDKEFLAGFADGTVHAISKSATKENLAAAFSPAAGDVLNFGRDEDRLIGGGGRPDFFDIPGVPRAKIEQLKVQEFLTKGIGNQVSFNVYDSVPTFDFNLPQFLGLTLGSFNGRRGFDTDTAMMGISFLIAALNSPVYISIPIKDSKVVDAFLDKLDPLMAESYRRLKEPGLIPIRFDFYKAPLKADRTMRVASVQFGPVKWRMFWARLGNSLSIASKAFILEDLAALENKRGQTADAGPEAHGLVRVRPANWDRVLADYRLGWAEGNREACLNNLAPLASVGRAIVAGSQAGERSEEQLGRAAHQEADRLYGAHFFCPEGGHYLLSPDGKTCRCSVHGTVFEPKQGTEPSQKGSAAALQGLSGVTAALTFQKDGLHAVVEIDRK